MLVKINNVAAPDSIQQNPSQAAVIFQSAPPIASDSMADRSTLSELGQPGSTPRANTEHEDDSRHDKPSTWDEVYLLQEALKPSVRSFARITSRTLPSVPGSLWFSYAKQVEILQRGSDRYWRVDRRHGDPPELAQLAAWRGGIVMVGEAEFRITEEMTAVFRHQNLCGTTHVHGSLSWYEDTFNEQMHNQGNKILFAADKRRERTRAQAAERGEPQDTSEDIMDILDNIVARDPERYLAWLSTMGYFYFTMNDHNPYGFSWEDWCTWKAPKSFEFCCKLESAVRRRPLGPGATKRTIYGPVGSRPNITLDEAKRGNRRAMEFRDVDDGLEVSSEENPQYYMLGGEATSRAAAALYYRIRGEDVWLFEPSEYSQEAHNDPSRQKEAEIEASFLCWQY